MFLQARDFSGFRMSRLPWSVAPAEDISLAPGADLGRSSQRGMSGLGCSVDCQGKGFSGLGLFDSGLNPSGWTTTEWLIVGGVAFLAFGGMKLLRGGKSGKRRRLELIRAKARLQELQA